jgi:hypothetical protein
MVSSALRSRLALRRVEPYSYFTTEGLEKNTGSERQDGRWGYYL